MAAAPLHSLDVVLAAAVAIGVGHGLSFLGAQDELNGMAPAERRGEVTSAFVCCIYATVGTAVILSGLLGLWTSLSVAVGIVAGALGLLAVTVSTWQVRSAGPRARRRRSVPA